MVKINKSLLPVKAHFFFFMGALGPILPQLSVYGKELGISPVVMGTVTGILPMTYLLAKFTFGVIVDFFRTYRKIVFVVLIILMTTSLAALYFVPAKFFSTYKMNNATYDDFKSCNDEVISRASVCRSDIRRVNCTCINSFSNFTLTGLTNLNKNTEICSFPNSTLPSYTACDLECYEDTRVEEIAVCQFDSTFWYFILLMSIASILFNVVNSISDAICFDVVGEDHDYGQQRVWGTIGWGVTAIAGGYAMDWWSPGAVKSYEPAFLIMIVFTIFDVLSCVKLKLPKMDPPKDILKDLRLLLSFRHTVVFLIFATLSGILDGFLIYFLLWYLEDLALEVHTTNVKFLEGAVVAAETLGTEILVFAVAGKILEKIGHSNCFTICFINYAIRCSMIALVPSPWWFIPIEFLMQGPTYALTYSTIVEYANLISPPSMSATTQGIAAGMDDGVGYAFGSIFGGLLYKRYGGRISFLIFAVVAVICAITHHLLYLFYVKGHEKDLQYKPPEEVPAETDKTDK